MKDASTNSHNHNNNKDREGKFHVHANTTTFIQSKPASKQTNKCSEFNMQANNTEGWTGPLSKATCTEQRITVKRRWQQVSGAVTYVGEQSINVRPNDGHGAFVAETAAAVCQRPCLA